MKFRLQSELRKGTPRWYLVRSEYVKATGKRRTVKTLYLGYSPNAKMKKLVARLNESLKRSKGFMGGELLSQIVTLKLQV